MTNKIGERIKNLRKKADITQEKLAEYLGITFQAVSRWERGDAYPDLEILPSIANYFNVTTDELLGVDIMNRQERIKEIGAQLQENYSKGFIDKNIEILRNAINEYPNDYSLLSSLAFCLGKKDETLNESIAINERILADCTDDRIRYNVIQKLAYSYSQIDEREKAIETAKKLPYLPVTADILLSSVYRGDQRIKQLQDNIKFFCDFIRQAIINFAYARYNDEKDTHNVHKRIELFEKAIGIFKLIYDDGDYGFYNIRMAHLYLCIAESYMLLSDFDNALDCIEEAADFVIAFDTLPEPFVHTSTINENIEFSKAKHLSKDNDYSDSYGLLHGWGGLLTDEKYIPIRETERFKAVTEKLEQYAKKEE